MKVISAICLAVFLGGTSLFAQFDVGIVLPFENNSRDPKLDWIGESFVEILSSDLASARFMVLDRRQRAAAFDSLGIPNTGILSEATAYKIAQTVDANKLILGTFDYSNGVFEAKARLLDMDSRTLSKEFVESGPFQNLIALQTGLAWQILRFLRPELTSSKGDFIGDHPGPRLDAFENYLRGLISKSRADQIQYFRSAMKLDPQFTKPAFGLGMIYFHDRDYPTSVLWLSKLRRIDADYVEANYFLGLAYLYREEYELSAAAFRVVAQQLPLNEVYNNLGIALMRQGRPGATAYFEKAIQSDPADPDYQFNYGYALWKRESYAQAIPHLRKALQGGNHPAWRLVYIQCLEKSGQKAEAARQESLLQQQSPEWSALKDPRQLQRLERPKDNYDGASFRQLRMLIQLRTEWKHSRLPLQEHVALHFEQAEKLLKQGFDREAAEELQQAVDYDPQNVEAYLELARMYMKAGRLEEAVKALNHSLQQRETATGRLLLAKIYLEQGKLDETQAQLNAALRLEPSSAEAAALVQEMNSKNIARQ
jgi:tetratricopeptide (TPR) repeat protein